MSKDGEADADAAAVPAAAAAPTLQGDSAVDSDQYHLLTAALESYGTAPHAYPAYGAQVAQPAWHMGGAQDAMPWQELYMDPYAGMQMYDPTAMWMMAPYGMGYQAPPRQKGGNGNQRRDGNKGGSSKPAATPPAPVPEGPHTTVMFRNIPNKYTRDMLVTQLESDDFTGKFDFVYLPMDFKHKCNVGYAFINFRTVEACETFHEKFKDFEVSKCMPGINSKKVCEVTPARVQGLEDNVQRLRNSPVMLELANHEEWMPLLFDEAGQKIPFPEPERTLPPIKPRRAK